MIRWEHQETEDWYGYSGELVVAMVVRPPGRAGDRWLWEVEGVTRPHGWRNSGHRTTPLEARRAADEYWARWLEAAALKPDLQRLAQRSSPAQAGGKDKARKRGAHSGSKGGRPGG